MVRFLVSGVLIGLVFGVPVGAVGAITVRRAVEHGPRAGLASGLGSTAADVAYACVSVLGLPAVSQLLADAQDIISVAGGIVLVALGICIPLRGPAEADAPSSGAGLPAYFWSSFALAASSPSAILLFLAAFSMFGVADAQTAGQKAALVLGIGCGTACWWAALALAAGRFQGRLGAGAHTALSRACGAAVALVGAAALASPLFR